MKILHISTQDKGGGSFDAAYRLHRNMLDNDIDSKMLVLRKVSNDDSVTSVSTRSILRNRYIYSWYTVKRKIQAKIFNFSPYFYIDSTLVFSLRSVLKGLPFSPDVIIAHWISGFMNADHLCELSRISGAPVLWYCMDMAPMTGGCHYMLDCDGYTRECGNCPQLGRKKGINDVSSHQWNRKFLSVQNANITAVVASSWQEKKLKLSSVFREKRSAMIPLGINPNIFCLRDQVEARGLLDLPTTRKIIFFGAMSIHEERKGIRYLFRALDILHEMLEGSTLQKKVLIVIAGNKENADGLDMAFEHRSVGYLSGDAALASAYQAADIFVCPSTEDAGPMMINESIMCGTPVVSFDVGVAMDLVLSGITGYRAKLRNESDMAAGIFKLLSMDSIGYQIMRNNCREIGLRLCDPANQVKAFENLCLDLLSDKK